MHIQTSAVVAAVISSLTIFSVRADTIQLVNGDTLHGDVVSLDDQQLRLHSEILGEISIGREKVAAISFGDRALPTSTPAENKPTNGNASTAKPVTSEPRQQVRRLLDSFGVDSEQTSALLNKLRAAAGSSSEVSRSEPAKSGDDVIQQLQTKGLDSGTMRELQSTFPLLALPGVKSYFDKTVSGLTTGEIDLQDLRQEAVKARQGLVEIKEDLGPSGAALNGYLRILDDFIRETEPSEDPAKPVGKDE